VTAGGGTTTLTVTPNVVTTLASGATITPLWMNSAHLNAAGNAAYYYWALNSKRADGSYVFTDPGTVRPIVYLGDSWAYNSPTEFAAAVHGRFPSAVAVSSGVIGDTSSLLLARFDASVPSNAAYVVFNEPGVNDVNASVTNLSQVKMAANIQALVTKIRAIGAIPVMTGIVPLSDYPGAALSASTQMRALCLPVAKTLPVLDTASADIRYASTVSPVFTSPTPAAPLSAQLLADSGLDTGTGWTAGAGWTISGSAAAHTSGTAALTQPLTIASGEIYLADITITGRTAGSVTMGIGSVVGFSTEIGSTALWASAHVAIYTTGSGSQNFAITPTTDFNGSVTVVTLKRVGLTVPAANYGMAQLRNPNTYSLSIGQEAQQRLTDAAGNVAIGLRCQMNNVTGTNNTALGWTAQNALAGAGGTTSVGAAASAAVTTGLNNTHIGSQAGFVPNAVAGNATTTASNQTCLGAQSGQGSATQSAAIVAIGYQATAVGNYAVAIGYLAKAGATNAVAIGQGTSAAGTGSVAIGRDTAGATASAPGADDFALGTASHKVKIAGRLTVAPRTPTSGADTSGNVGDIASDDNYVYAKTSTGWKRAALTTW